MSIYIYKMTVDNGGAPCTIDHAGNSLDTLTLAICKPVIRRVAKEGDIIIGFGGKSLDEKLIFIAKITRKITGQEYYAENSNFRDRADCIYTFMDNVYNQQNNPFHDAKSLEHDLGKKFKNYPNNYVLLSESNDYVYFGRNATTYYKRYNEIANMVSSMTRNHRVNFSNSLRNQLKQLINEYIPNITQQANLPTHQPVLSKERNGNCSCVPVVRKKTKKCKRC